MELSPYLEANNHSASQDIPCLLCSPEVHYRVHKSLSLLVPSWARWIQSTATDRTSL